MPGLIAHEWFAEAGGSENVVLEFLASFPDSDLFVLWNDRGPEIARKVYESWLAGTPLRAHKALALPLMPPTWRAVRLEQHYDWVLTSSHLFAHHLRLRGQSRDIPKLVYTHTPARYIWAPDYDERGAGWLPRVASKALKPLDRRRAQEAVSITANSQFTKKRVEEFWGRDARVIYPPVNVEDAQSVADWSARLGDSEQASLDALPQDFLLGASRFVPYKRLDLVIRVGEVAGLPVVLAGDGPSAGELRALADRATVPVIFVGRPSNAFLYALYQRAQAYVFPAVEDFGIMPVEAMALGTPVIVPLTGGAAESVDALAGGFALPEFADDLILSALDGLGSVDRDGLKDRARLFSRGRFRAEISAWVQGEVNR